MRLLRVGLSWVLYTLGDLWCRGCVNRGLGNWFEWPYDLYNRLMVSSANLQGDDVRGPWR